MTGKAHLDIEIPFGGKTYSVKPDFATICAIEGALNQPSRTLGMKAYVTGMPLQQRNGATEISLMEIATIVALILKDKGVSSTPTAVGEALMEDGYGQLLVPIGDYLMRAQRGHKEHEKEAALAAEQADPPNSSQES